MMALSETAALAAAVGSAGRRTDALALTRQAP